MDYYEYPIKTIATDHLGSLSFFESTNDVPFEIKRIYFIHGVPGNAKRGGHAHTNLQQLLFCPYGEIEILLNDGEQQKSIILDSPDKGLYIGNNIWRDMVWKIDNSILCVAASQYYSENDYIRNYENFIKQINLSKESKL